jgi:hypothetical protein
MEYTKKEAIKLLKDLHISHNINRYPDTPINYIPCYNYKDNTANGLTKCIISFLRFKGYQAERINCTGRPIDRRKQVTDILGNSRIIGSIEYAHTTGTRGTSDISATIKGLSVKIEVKIGTDRQSVYQKSYQKSVENSGGLYFIAKDFAQFLNWYNCKFESHGK